MQQTPKIKKKLLTLSNRKGIKRQNESPKRFTRSSQQNGTTNSNNFNVCSRSEKQMSPSVVSISLDNGIECTPPHRKFNLDDSIDYSPRSFDSSFSPSNLLSQTLAIDSPEVGWRWSRGSSNGTIEISSMKTPDSAYAADSSYSSGIDSNGKEKAKSDLLKSLNYELKRVECRRAYEMEIRRAEKTKADEMLKKRCDKLQEQLKEAELRSKCDKEKKAADVNNEKEVSKTNFKTKLFPDFKTNPLKTPDKSQKTSQKDNFDDFFNDSDIDCFLLEATQQCESKISKMNQKPLDCKVPDLVAEYGNAVNSNDTTPKATVNKEKRASLYMQLLEDDFNDDWLASLDEEVMKATQPKKPRTSLQRYKSMPSEATSDATGSPISTKSTSNYEAKAATSIETPKFKRYSSSHAISPLINHSSRQRKL